MGSFTEDVLVEIFEFGGVVGVDVFFQAFQNKRKCEKPELFLGNAREVGVFLDFVVFDFG